jgi:hypothetical protein
MDILSSTVTTFESVLPLSRITEITGAKSDIAKGWTNGERNWTIGYCNSFANAIQIINFFLSILTCAYMSTRCQRNVNKLSTAI